jgi:VIT1/CCC1 family predicted Fe2+/Mn2+ transporter
MRKIVRKLILSVIAIFVLIAILTKPSDKQIKIETIKTVWAA